MNEHDVRERIVISRGYSVYLYEISANGLVEEECVRALTNFANCSKELYTSYKCGIKLLRILEDNGTVYCISQGGDLYEATCNYPNLEDSEGRWVDHVLVKIDLRDYLNETTSGHHKVPDEEYAIVHEITNCKDVKSLSALFKEICSQRYSFKTIVALDSVIRNR